MGSISIIIIGSRTPDARSIPVGSQGNAANFVLLIFSSSKTTYYNMNLLDFVKSSSDADSGCVILGHAARRQQNIELDEKTPQWMRYMPQQQHGQKTASSTSTTTTTTLKLENTSKFCVIAANTTTNSGSTISTSSNKRVNQNNNTSSKSKVVKSTRSVTAGNTNTTAFSAMPARRMRASFYAASSLPTSGTGTNRYRASNRLSPSPTPYAPMPDSTSTNSSSSSSSSSSRNSTQRRGGPRPANTDEVSMLLQFAKL